MPRAYPREEHLKGDAFGQAQALLTNIRLGWYGLPGTNSVVYLAHSQVTKKKVFIPLPPSHKKGPKFALQLYFAICYNTTANIRHLCQKITFLIYHRCLILSIVENMNNVYMSITPLTCRGQCYTHFSSVIYKFS
jgi:hypothetical protein